MFGATCRPKLIVLNTLLTGVICWAGIPASADTSIPMEPVAIGQTPQLFVDNFIVDNTWTLKYKTQHIERVFHAPVKHAANPLVRESAGYTNVAFDREAGVYHMWYQAHLWGDDDAKTKYGIGYATSRDGLSWSLPKLKLHDWNGSKDNNIVLCGPRHRASGPCLLEVPVEHRHGYKYLLSYRDTDGMHVVGTNDGVHFDAKGDTPILKLHSDTMNSIVYDPHARLFRMYCRAKAIYRAFGEEMIDTGESRRIAMATSPELWSKWSHDAPQILLPDELDTKQRYHAFYGMPVKEYAGIFFGMLWCFRWNDLIHTELAWSRDGVRFDRHPLRPRLIDYGPEGSWDDEMTFGTPWVEVGDQWLFYYAGWDGPHGSRERASGIGLAALRKEGFISLHGPAGGGVVCTRTVLWPGDKLSVNAAVADKGKLTVRVSDDQRKVIPGFDHSDCVPVANDATTIGIRWKEHSIEELKGKPLRLEFFLQDADLYSFRAGNQ